MTKDENGEYLNTVDDFEIIQNVVEHTSGLKRATNWVKVQKILFYGTTHDGSTSSKEKCVELGVDPYSTKWERKDRAKGGSYYDRESWQFYSDSVAEVPIRMRWHKLGLDGKKKYCRVCGKELRYTYNEERLYTIYCKECGIVTMIQAESPDNAAIAMGAVYE